MPGVCAGFAAFAGAAGLAWPRGGADSLGGLGAALPWAAALEAFGLLTILAVAIVRDPRRVSRRLLGSFLASTGIGLLGVALCAGAHTGALGSALVAGALAYRLGAVPAFAWLPMLLRHPSRGIEALGVAGVIGAGAVLARVVALLPQPGAAFSTLGALAVITIPWAVWNAWRQRREDPPCARTYLVVAGVAIILLTVAIRARPHAASVDARPVAVPPTTGRPPRRRVTAPPMPALGPTCGGHCGTERWLVKTLSDPDRDCVNLTVVDATVEELAALPEPERRPSAGRLKPVECTVYRVEAFLGGWDTFMKLEHDGDDHLVLFGRTNQRVSIIAEIPDPECDGACRSGFAERFMAARNALEAGVRRPNPGDLNPVVRVTGVGFFDYLHHQTGVSPNGFELHPVLSIEFLPLGTPARRKVSRPGASHYVGRLAGR